jgi:MFS family permease
MPQRSILILFLIIFFDWVALGVVFPTVPFMAMQFGGSGFEIGCLIALPALLQRFFAPLWERLSDFIGRRPMLLLGTLGNAFSLLILGMAGSLGWLFIGRGLTGIANANVTLAYALLLDYQPKDPGQRGVIAAASGLGLVFGPAIGGLLSRYGYGMPLFFAASLSLAAALLAVFRLEEPELAAETRAQHHPVRFSGSAFAEAWYETICPSVVPIHFLVTAAAAMLEAVFCIYLAYRYGEDAETAGVLLATMGLILISMQSKNFLRWFRARAAWASNESRLIIVSAGVAAIGMGFFSLSSFWFISMIGLLAMSVAQGFLLPAVSRAAFGGISNDRRLLTLGVFQTSAGLARILAPPVAGWLFDQASWRSPFFIAALLLAVALALSFRNFRQSAFGTSPS